MRDCCLLVEGWAQWYGTLCVDVVDGHHHVNSCRLICISAAAFAVLEDCDTLLVVSVAALMDASAAISDAARLVFVSATAAVRHG